MTNDMLTVLDDIPFTIPPYSLSHPPIHTLPFTTSQFPIHTLSFTPFHSHQAMTNDMLTVLNDIPFTIPPYFALLARAVVTLEGLALGADPNYGLILEAYPFVARKLLSSDRCRQRERTVYRERIENRIYIDSVQRASYIYVYISLGADPNYGLILKAYPFVARKLLSSDR